MRKAIKRSKSLRPKQSQLAPNTEGSLEGSTGMEHSTCPYLQEVLEKLYLLV